MQCLSEFRDKIPDEGRLLSVDHGRKRIGLAICDISRQFVNPLDVLSHAKFSENAKALKKIVVEQKVVGLVVGYPLNMDGSEGPRCQSVRQFVRNLESYIDLPVLLWDERLSSNIAHEQMLEADLRAAKRGAKVDKLAAGAILQSYLEE